MQNEAIIIENIVKNINDSPILKNISIKLRKGIIFGLIGPNGAGKTTLIKVISNIYEPTSGRIIIFGDCLKKDDFEIKNKMGVIYENNESLFQYLTGIEYLRFISDIYKIDKKTKEKKIDEIILFLDLEDHIDKLIGEYSKGMKTKLAFGSLLLHQPEIIIMDELFDGLDAYTIVKVKKILKILKNKGTTILISSHILSYVEDLCDEVAIINKGQIIYQSATKEIRNQIKDNVTKETYKSLEEIFIELTTEKADQEKTLSWL